jgi:hypothetical protein
MNEDQIKSAIKYGTVVQLVGVLIDGTRCKVLRQSKKTGGLTVELTEDNGSCYRQGSQLHVNAYQVERVQPRHHEFLEAYNDELESTMRSLRRHVQHGLDIRLQLSERLLSSESESVAKMMAWGEGVKADLMAGFAGRILVLVGGGHATLEQALKYSLEDYQRQVDTNQDSGGSSSSYSNAVDEEKRAVRREAMDFCRRALTELNRARAMIEVL